jgi:hypothetical protein
VEIAARVLDALECGRFGGGRTATATIPMIPRRKTG